MADNPTIDNGGLTDYVVATDDDGTAHHQLVKVEWGPNNTQTVVDTGASALPVQDGGNSLTVDDGGSSLTVDGTVSISSSTASPVTVTVGSAASDLGKAEDAAHASGDVGVMALAVRNDNLSAFSGTDGDYTPLATNSAGVLYVKAPSDTAIQTMETVDYVYYTSENASKVVLRGAISTSASGNTTILAAQGASANTLVMGVYLMSAGTVNVTFTDGAGGTALTGAIPLIANTGFVLPISPHGWMLGSANTALVLNLDAAVQVSGVYVYTVL